MMSLSKPKVVHHDRMWPYKGSASPTWHHDKLVQEEDLHANEPQQGQDNDMIEDNAPTDEPEVTDRLPDPDDI